MKESITKEIEKEIEQKKKLPKEVKDEMNKQVFRNLTFAISIIIYFIFLNLGYLNIEKSVFIKDTAVFAMTCLIVAIALFERAYSKEKGFLAIHGLEVLAVALFTLFTPYTYFYLAPVVSKIMMMVPLAFGIYYVAKSAIICVRIQVKQNNKISDIKEIVKKETRSFEENIEMDKDEEAETVEKTSKKRTQKEELKDKKVKTAKKTKKEGENNKTVKSNKKESKEKTKKKSVKTPKKKEEITSKKATTTKKSKSRNTGGINHDKKHDRLWSRKI